MQAILLQGHILGVTLDDGPWPYTKNHFRWQSWSKISRNNLRQIESLNWALLHIKRIFFWNTMNVFKGILSNFKVQLVKMWEYLRERGWHFIFILLQVGAILGVVGKPLASQILKIYLTISELLCGGYWFLSGFCWSKFKQIAKIGFKLGPMS
jgi:hypothetical protein